MQDILQNNFQIGEIMESVWNLQLQHDLALALKESKQRERGNSWEQCGFLYFINSFFFKPDRILQFFYQNIKNNQHNHDIVEITTINGGWNSKDFWQLGYSLLLFWGKVILVIFLFLFDLVIGGVGTG